MSKCTCEISFLHNIRVGHTHQRVMSQEYMSHGNLNWAILDRAVLQPSSWLLYRSLLWGPIKEPCQRALSSERCVRHDDSRRHAPSLSYAREAMSTSSGTSSRAWLVDVCDMTRWCVWHDSWPDSLMCVTWLVDVCDMTRWCVCHDSLMCVTWLVDVCIPSEWCANRKNDTRARVTHVHLRCTCMCDMTHIHLWHASRTNVTWLTYTWDSCTLGVMSQEYVWHDSRTHVTWLVDMCDMTRWCVWRVINESCRSLVRVMSQKYLQHDSHTHVIWLVHVWHDSLMCVTSWWTRFVPSLHESCRTSLIRECSLMGLFSRAL